MGAAPTSSSYFRVIMTIPATLLFLFLPIATYLGCYYALGIADDFNFEGQPPTRVRFYRKEWQAAVFRPLARGESRLGHRQVKAVCDIERFAIYDDVRRVRALQKAGKLP